MPEPAFTLPGIRVHLPRNRCSRSPESVFTMLWNGCSPSAGICVHDAPEYALNMPRIIFAAARDGVISPKSLANIRARYSTPHVAIISYATLACFFACTGEFKQLAMLASASFLLIYLGVILAVIKYRITKEDKVGAYKMPGGYFIPVASALAIVWFLSNLPRDELSAMLIFLALLSVFYSTINFWRRRHT